MDIGNLVQSVIIIYMAIYMVTLLLDMGFDLSGKYPWFETVAKVINSGFILAMGMITGGCIVNTINEPTLWNIVITVVTTVITIVAAKVWWD